MCVCTVACLPCGIPFHANNSVLCSSGTIDAEIGVLSAEKLKVPSFKPGVGWNIALPPVSNFAW